MNNKQQNTIVFLLRICTCLIAAVSFWATAQGMIGYTFPSIFFKAMQGRFAKIYFISINFGYFILFIVV